MAYVVLPSAGNNGLFNLVVGPHDQGGELLELVASPELDPDQQTTQPWHGFAVVEIAGDRLELVTWQVEDGITAVDALVVER